ncbi:PIG-L deacetylase family protein [Deinococcus planocerae]|uniref:PIG-L deacetylase family protein n=1 Tax=Deinococcus planocerae TaxID=1737569 RepID=UPI001C6410E2|nr:PIG-L family deacetylase [Deinococcus planocerae]
MSRLLGRPRRRHLWVGAVLLAALLAAFAINSPAALRLLYPRAVAEVAALPPAPGYRAGQRVLMVSPHPDDESLCCAGNIQHALAAGAEVYIVWLTSGDGFELDAALLEHTPRPRGRASESLGAVRIREATRAAAALGVPASHLFFLGYPDGALLRMLRADSDTPTASPHTRATRVPYPQALSPGAPYTAASLRRDLSTVLGRVRPDVVLLPSTHDFHHDHVATSLVTADLLAQRGETGRERLWIVHGGAEWPVPKGLHAGFPLLIPPRGRHLAWTRLDLTAAQQDTKLRALQAHASQMEVMPRFLKAFVRENELITLPEEGK